MTESSKIRILTHKLSNNEILAKNLNICEGTLGCEKAESDVMITIVKETILPNTFDCVDVFMSYEQVEKLAKDMMKIVIERKSKKYNI